MTCSSSATATLPHGTGYELQTKLIVGSTCVCVADSCADGAEGKQDAPLTDAERSFGKASKEEAEAPVSDGGIKFIFTPKAE